MSAPSPTSNRSEESSDARTFMGMQPLRRTRGRQHKGIADTFVQLFPLCAAGLIAIVDASAESNEG